MVRECNDAQTCATNPTASDRVGPVHALEDIPRNTEPYQMEDLAPIDTCPMTDALGATKTSVSRLGRLSYNGINRRWRLTIRCVVTSTATSSA
jgi:hypothetical protein